MISLSDNSIGLYMDFYIWLYYQKDDIVILSESKEGLQECLKNVYDYNRNCI